MKHIVNISGGKDSQATYCIALERGFEFRAVAADTENENSVTYEAISRLSEITGGPKVELVRGDFTDRIRSKRDYIATNWAKPHGDFPDGVPAGIISSALAILDDRLAHPEQANAYLDLCLWKGRFPSKRMQFCTEELKVKVIDQHVTRPMLSTGDTVISWQGVRAAESFERSLLPPLQRLVSNDDLPGRLYAYRPLLRVATVEEVFAISARHGLPPNPLYALGASRVGCLPCVNCVKAEVGLVARHFPEQLDRIEAWEIRVSGASKRGCATFFSIAKDPVMVAEIAYFEALGQPLSIRPETHGIRRYAEYAKTLSGGRQIPLFPTDAPTCAAYGVCE